MLTLRPYQQEAIGAIYQYFEGTSGNPLVVLPTGTGKSVVLSAFIAGALQGWPETRVLVITHVKELIAQNHAEMLTLWPSAPAGIYSAGLNQRDLTAQVLFGGIQSLHRRAYDVQACDLVLIDEAHLIPRRSDTMYRRFLDELRRINPQLKVVGLTATPYRLDSGLLHEGEDALFDAIAYDANIADMIRQGYLCEVVPKRTATRLDVSGVGTRGGEFIAGELERAIDIAAVTEAAVDEIVGLGNERRSWLIFCAGVAHAEHVRDAIRARGISCDSVLGNTPAPERDGIVAAYKRGEIRCLTNANVLTTGFNAPAVDLIAMLRPTKSVGLYVQMVGRGTRLAAGKENCLVLDFAGNTERHGPIDTVDGRRRKTGEDGIAPTKVCPDCETILHASIRVCPTCGHAFPPPEPKLSYSAATSALLSTQIAAQWLDVSTVSYARHEKLGGRPSLRVDYVCGLAIHSEWVCLEHTGYPRQKAAAWWQRRAPGIAVPNTVSEALALTRQLAQPQRIRVRPQGRFTEVTSHEFPSCSAPSAAARPAASASTPGSPASTAGRHGPAPSPASTFAMRGVA
jgi:DNA repair protein RadD